MVAAKRSDAHQAAAPMHPAKKSLVHTMSQSFSEIANFIWSVADLLRGDYKQSDYGKVILPFTVLRRIDCVLAPTKDAVLQERKRREAQGMPTDAFLRRASGAGFYNASELDLKKLLGDQDNVAANLRAYLLGFSPEVRDIFEHFDFDIQIDRLA